jgi:hypothetical protein
VRLVGGIVATLLLAFLALKLWIEGNDDVCSGADTLRCSDGVVSAAGVALWVLLALPVGLTVLGSIRLARWVRSQRRPR